jgi:serine/threonine protein kinase
MHEVYAECGVATPMRTSGRETLIGADDALVGNIVAERYVVGDVLGTGATGTVFALEHVTFARAAAMKVLRSRFGSPELVSRVFHGEARAAWSVTHPCLCEVFDIGTLPDGAPFFVMERLDGETLATRIARGRLSIASSVDAMMQLLSAIAAIHERDLLLRDLRPQNIFLAQRRGCRPLLKILDFGLARLSPLDRVQAEWDAAEAHPSPSSGRTPTAIPYYLSPERARGEHGIEPASDLFVAGTILYEMLAAERPFSGTSFGDLLGQICDGKHVPLRSRRPEISEDLSAFVSQVLSPNPRERPGSAREMQEELRSTFEGGRKGSHATSASGLASSSVQSASFAVPLSSATVETVTDVGAPAPSIGPNSATLQGRPPVLLQSSKDPLANGSKDAARRRHEDLYLDETETRHELSASAPAGGHSNLPRVNAEPFLHPDELSTASKPIDPALLDEASAANADRTVPPPLGSSGGPPRGATAGSRRDRSKDFDDETETTPLTPELRARVDELLKDYPSPLPRPAEISAVPKPAPPPLPHRSTKPRR